ncbi:PH domain-containing protein [Bacillus sp. FSL W7-1360]
MRAEPSLRLPKKVIRVWRLQNLLNTLFWLLIPVVYELVRRFIFTNFYEWITWVLLALVVLDLIINVIIWPPIRWRRFRYEVYDDEIDIREGVLVVTRTLVPMVRVQHVDTVQGPILRKHDMSVVSITSAAETHEIPGLDVADADQVRDQIAKLAAVTEDD